MYLHERRTWPTLKSHPSLVRDLLRELDGHARTRNDFEAVLVYNLASLKGFDPDEIASLRDHYADSKRRHHGSE